jgi:(E)-4-hydroxy-3-methylbut-2-enyl-diphosphate synthase
VVNGPGEALMTDIGLTGGGAGTHMVYGMGKQSHTVKTEEMVEHIVGLVSARAEAMAAAKRAEAERQAAE